ncbi:MAG TPA: ECF transporter S component [Spirochaetia bacterium]|nr:ECF transporter S component [Spirochaetia bacterium]
MTEERPAFSPAFRIASIAVLAAVTTVLTRVVQVPLPARGYINLGDVAIVFTAITLGPWSGALAGGLGTALADLLSGPFAFWAPISLVVHGVQGLVVGAVAAAKPGNVLMQIVGGIAGIAVMGGGYLAAGVFLEGAGPAFTEVPGNLIQGGAGVLLGILAGAAVLRAYPPVRQWKW